MDPIKPIKIVSISSKPRHLQTQSKSPETLNDPIALDYKSYIESFKSSKKKKNYSFSLVSKISEVQLFQKSSQKISQVKKFGEKILKDRVKEETQKLESDQQTKLAEELRLMELAKQEELIRLELLKKQSVQDWMKQNFEVFAEKKKKIQKEIEEAKRVQREKIEGNEKVNKDRYNRIVEDRLEGKRLSVCIGELDQKRENFIRELELERKREEEENGKVKITVAEQIREKLKSSGVLQQISDCFDNKVE